MSLKKIWNLPFEVCYSQCVGRLDRAYYAYVSLCAVLSLPAVGLLSTYFSFEARKKFPLSYEWVVAIFLSGIFVFFLVLWKIAKEIILYFQCRHCR